jgi:hypothetical protein
MTDFRTEELLRAKSFILNNCLDLQLVIEWE